MNKESVKRMFKLKPGESWKVPEGYVHVPKSKVGACAKKHIDAMMMSYYDNGNTVDGFIGLDPSDVKYIKSYMGILRFAIKEEYATWKK